MICHGKLIIKIKIIEENLNDKKQLFNPHKCPTSLPSILFYECSYKRYACLSVSDYMIHTGQCPRHLSLTRPSLVKLKVQDKFICLLKTRGTLLKSKNSQVLPSSFFNSHTSSKKLLGS